MLDLYYEDLFYKFVSHVLKCSSQIDNTDLSAMISFSNMIKSQESLTSRQASYALRLMKKYSHISSQQGFDIDEDFNKAAWKKPFRVIDHTKKVWIDAKKDPYSICLRYPYEYKNIFDSAMFQILDSNERFFWDKEEKVTKISIYRTKLLILHDILEKHNFEMDDSYVDLFSKLEIALENEENIVPHSIIQGNSVILKNISQSAEDYWKKNKTNQINDDLFIAKQMGFLLKNDTDDNVVKKIVKSANNKFWTPDFDKFFELCEKVSGVKIIFIGGHRDFFNDLKKILDSLRKTSIPLNKVKVCFRESGENGKIFNNWIRENHLGGKISNEDILIFKDKIPKWVLSKNIDVKIIGINELYPVTNRYTRIWCDSHYCVIFLGEFKASATKGEYIASL